MKYEVDECRGGLGEALSICCLRLSLGQKFSFGHYPTAMTYPIQYSSIFWQVVRIDKTYALALACLGIEHLPFHSNALEGVTWEASDIRAWLNNEFYYNSFNQQEKSALELANTSTNSCWEHRYELKPRAQDHVFLLNREEIEQAFPTAAARRLRTTHYAHCRGVLVAHNYSLDSSQCCSYWLRPRGDELSPFPKLIESVDVWGKTEQYLPSDASGLAIRPALLLRLAD